MTALTGRDGAALDTNGMLVSNRSPSEATEATHE